MVHVGGYLGTQSFSGSRVSEICAWKSHLDNEKKDFKWVCSTCGGDGKEATKIYKKNPSMSYATRYCHTSKTNQRFKQDDK